MSIAKHLTIAALLSTGLAAGGLTAASGAGAAGTDVVGARPATGHAVFLQQETTTSIEGGANRLDSVAANDGNGGAEVNEANDLNDPNEQDEGNEANETNEQNDGPDNDGTGNTRG